MDVKGSREPGAALLPSERPPSGGQGVGDRARAGAILAGEARLFELVALGRPLAVVLDALCKLVEELLGDCSCWVLWASSRWPPQGAGHPQRPSWSVPILSGSGKALGALAIHRRGTPSSTGAERALSERLTKVARIAIERADADHALRSGAAALRLAHDQLSQVQRLRQPATDSENIEELLRGSDVELRRAHDQLFEGKVPDGLDLRFAEERLDQARTELAQAARAAALGAFTASIAHEVNQPLAGVITNASTCLRMLAADTPNILGAQLTVQRVIRDGHRASEVVKRLRGLFARKPPRTEPVDLDDAAREILILSSNELQSGQVALQAELAGNLPAVVGDRVQLQQVILNLVLNAAQAMAGIEGRPHNLRVWTAREGLDQVTLSVRDSGVGVAGKDLEQLFNPFYTTKPDGMGVGLSLSRSIIEAHGGRLWARTNEGPGLTLSFSLPTTRPAEPV
jgi:C4-dicarboxylate-specific signal transduction histidine kinase